MARETLVNRSADPITNPALDWRADVAVISGGRPRPGCRGQGKRAGQGMAEARVLQPGGNGIFSRRIDCDEEPGSYQARALAAGVESALVLYEIAAPDGDDLAAFTAFGGRPMSAPDEVAARFPGSTDAGHMLLRDGPWPLDPVSELRARDEFLGGCRSHPAGEGCAQVIRLHEIFAGALLGALPMLIIFLVLQRYIVSGLTAGAVKG